MRLAVIFGSILLFLAFVILRTRLKMLRLSRLSWNDLLAKLEPVCTSGISLIAIDYLQPTKGQIGLEPHELWALIGGSEGLRRMYANAEVLLALAGYAQRWNFDESVIVHERMRRDGAALRRATFKLSMGDVFGNDHACGPFRVQEAASAYYLMRERLLALYETSHAGRYSALADAV